MIPEQANAVADCVDTALESLAEREQTDEDSLIIISLTGVSSASSAGMTADPNSDIADADEVVSRLWDRFTSDATDERRLFLLTATAGLQQRQSGDEFGMDGPMRNQSVHVPLFGSAGHCEGLRIALRRLGDPR